MRIRIILTIVVFLSSIGPSIVLGRAESARSWKTVDELSETERTQIDLRTDTPRDPQIPYLPAEKYPFTPPYTAEEMGYRAMEFPHFPRWSCALTDAYGSITSGGSLQQGKTTGVMLYIPEDRMQGYLYATSAGKVYFRWLFQDTAPPENYGNQMLWVGHRTDRTFAMRLDSFFYSPSQRRVRHMPQPRRDDRFPNNVQTMDDILGRDAWEFSWRLLGTDVLYETVRFPTTRSTVTVARDNGSFAEVPVKELKMLGDAYPHYTSEGGVECYVVAVTARDEWLPNYSTPQLIYWIDRHHFYPLRIESYDRDGKLVRIEDRTARLANPALKERGYASELTVYYDLALDLMSYAFHDSYEPSEWPPEEQQVLFNPDSMRRGQLVTHLKAREEVRTPQEFYLRPHLYRNKFSQDRRIDVPADVDARIRAQEAAGHLVFDVEE